ncbi:hypothetical protein RclHR1_12780007 [Rhizophagus clarus]|uniref:Uncharacterized protein n=1 Tax=Rhizophagus clarus TaxID=94130 RepID=A0A2Z6Q872_9GLOM|nr:hypothetical protein RclHR1_12780007 [Rhizophagus clarus]
MDPILIRHSLYLEFELKHKLLIEHRILFCIKTLCEMQNRFYMNYIFTRIILWEFTRSLHRLNIMRTG